MIVGCLGDIIFAVFDGYVKTIKDMAQSVSARYTTHQRAGGKALAEFTGTDADTITFDIELSAYLGVAPSKQREILKGYVDNHTTLPFVLGNEVFGSYRWVIKSEEGSPPRGRGKARLAPLIQLLVGITPA